MERAVKKHGQSDFKPTNMDWVKRHLGYPVRPGGGAEEVYPDLDEKTGMHCVFGVDSGHAYSTHSDFHSAQEEADRMNNQVLSTRTEKQDPTGTQSCPGCGCMPGEGITPECNDPNGCGYWKSMKQAQKDPKFTEQYGQSKVDGVPTKDSEYELKFFAEADQAPGSFKPPSYYAERIVQALVYYNTGDAEALYDNVITAAKKEGLTGDQQDAIDALLIKWNVPVPVKASKVDPMQPAKSDYTIDYKEHQRAAQAQQCPSCGFKTHNPKLHNCLICGQKLPVSKDRSQWYPEEASSSPMAMRDASFPHKSLAATLQNKKQLREACDRFLGAYKKYTADTKGITARYLKGQLETKITTHLKNNFTREEIAKEIPTWSFPEEMKKEALSKLLPKKVALAGPRFALSNERAQTRSQRQAEAIQLMAKHSSQDNLTKEQKLRIAALKSKFKFATPPWLVTAEAPQYFVDSTDEKDGKATEYGLMERGKVTPLKISTNKAELQEAAQKLNKGAKKEAQQHIDSKGTPIKVGDVIYNSTELATQGPMEVVSTQGIVKAKDQGRNPTIQTISNPKNYTVRGAQLEEQKEEANKHDRGMEDDREGSGAEAFIKKEDKTQNRVAIEVPGTGTVTEKQWDRAKKDTIAKGYKICGDCDGKGGSCKTCNGMGTVGKRNSATRPEDLQEYYSRHEMGPVPSSPRFDPRGDPKCPLCHGRGVTTNHGSLCSCVRNQRKKNKDRLSVEDNPEFYGKAHPDGRGRFFGAVKLYARLEDGRVLEAAINDKGECQSKASLDYELKKAIRKNDSFESGWVAYLSIRTAGEGWKLQNIKSSIEHLEEKLRKSEPGSSQRAEAERELPKWRQMLEEENRKSS